jgi:hypothetical protein
MPDRLDALCQHAADLGLEVEWTCDLPGDCHGYYEDDARLVVLNYRCTIAQAVSALAHEIGHAVFGDRCSTDAVERRADEYGASLVLTAEDYAAAEREVGPHPGALARRLGVTRDLVLAWRRWWWRTGRVAEAA